MTIAIIGSGLAGYTAAKELRKLNGDVPLHVITSDEGAFYSKPMLSNGYAKGKNATTLATASAEHMAAQLKATVWNHTQVDAIDTAAHTLHAAGKTVEYAKLVMAVGAQPLPPPVTDVAKAVYTVNDLADYARFRDCADAAQSVVVIGSGLIGCEFANDLAATGKRVTVIGPARTPLDRLLPTPAGQALQRALEGVGVQWHLGMTAERVEREDDATRVILNDGSVVEADCILSAIGLRPNVALATAAGLTVQRGIVVNRYLETSAPDVYALGDCAEVEGLVLPFVMPIMQASRALAATLAGTRTSVLYPAMPVVVKTPAHPIVVSPPSAQAQGAWHIDEEADGVRCLFRGADGSLLGFALTGSTVAEKQALTKELPPLLP